MVLLLVCVVLLAAVVVDVGRVCSLLDTCWGCLSLGLGEDSTCTGAVGWTMALGGSGLRVRLGLGLRLRAPPTGLSRFCSFLLRLSSFPGAADGLATTAETSSTTLVLRTGSATGLVGVTLMGWKRVVALCAASCCCSSSNGLNRVGTVGENSLPVVVVRGFRVRGCAWGWGLLALGLLLTAWTVGT